MDMKKMRSTPTYQAGMQLPDQWMIMNRYPPPQDQPGMVVQHSCGSMILPQ